MTSRGATLPCGGIPNPTAVSHARKALIAAMWATSSFQFGSRAETVWRFPSVRTRSNRISPAKPMI